MWSSTSPDHEKLNNFQESILSWRSYQCDIYLVKIWSVDVCKNCDSVRQSFLQCLSLLLFTRWHCCVHCVHFSFLITFRAWIDRSKYQSRVRTAYLNTFSKVTVKKRDTCKSDTIHYSVKNPKKKQKKYSKISYKHIYEEKEDGNLCGKGEDRKRWKYR